MTAHTACLEGTTSPVSCPDLFRASNPRCGRLQGEWIAGTSPAMTHQGLAGADNIARLT